MGIYRTHVLPRIVNVTCAMTTLEPLRRRVCAGLTGRVVEIGFGSGLNVPFYPPALRLVTAIEPADLGWKLARERVAASPVTVERSGLDGQSLPLDDATYDTALSTWTICTIPDPLAALRELRRVLKPGGTLHFVEHGLAPDEDVRRRQRRIEPLQRFALGGCHLTRQMLPLLAEAGFVVTESDAFYEEGAPKAMGALTLGVARTPA